MIVMARLFRDSQPLPCLRRFCRLLGSDQHHDTGIAIGRRPEQDVDDQHDDQLGRGHPHRVDREAGRDREGDRLRAQVEQRFRAPNADHGSEVRRSASSTPAPASSPRRRPLNDLPDSEAEQHEAQHQLDGADDRLVGQPGPGRDRGDPEHEPDRHDRETDHPADQEREPRPPRPGRQQDDDRRRQRHRTEGDAERERQQDAQNLHGRNLSVPRS